MSPKFKVGDLIRMQERYKNYWHDDYNYALVLMLCHEDGIVAKPKYKVLLRAAI